MPKPKKAAKKRSIRQGSASKRAKTKQVKPRAKASKTGAKRKASARRAAAKPKRKAARKLPRAAARPQAKAAPARKKAARTAPPSHPKAKTPPSPGSPRTGAPNATKPERAPLVLVPHKKVAAPKAAATARSRARVLPSERTSKQRVLFEMIRSRTVVHTAIQNLPADAANRPIAEGKWSPREIVLHLAARDLARLRELETVLRGGTASWWSYSDEEMDRDNAEALEPVEALGWDEAVQHLNVTRRELLESLEGLPEDPADVWSLEHTFGRMLYGLPEHDRHHASAIRRWRDAQGL